MSNQRKNNLVKQGAILAVAGLIVKIIGFLYRIPLTNLIGFEGMGYYGSAFQVYSVLLIISSYGIPVALSRILIEKRQLGKLKEEEQVFRMTTFLCMGLSALSAIILWFYSVPISKLLYKGSEGALAIKALAPAILICGGLSILRGYFQSRHTMVPTAISQVLEQVFNALGSFLFAMLFVKKSIEAGAAGGTLGTGFGALFGLLFLIYIFVNHRKREEKISLKGVGFWDTKLFKDLLRLLIPITLISALTSIIGLIDFSMLSYGLDSTGFTESYSSEMKGIYVSVFLTITNVPIGIATALGVGALPSLSKSFIAKDYNLAKYKINKMIKTTVLVSVPSAVGLCVLAEPIVTIYKKSDIIDGAFFLKIAAPYVVLFSLVQITNAILQSMGKMKIPLKNNFIAGCFKILANVVCLFVFEMGATGIIVANTIFGFIILVLNVNAIGFIIKLRFSWNKILVKPFISSVVMGVVAAISYFYLQKIMLPLIACGFAIIFAIGTYGMSLIAFKGITADELAMLPMGKRLSRLFKLDEEQ